MLQGVAFSPSSGWGHRRGDPTVVEPDPVVFGFARAGLGPSYTARCASDGRVLTTRVEALPSSPDTDVARIEVETGSCTAFVVEAKHERSSAYRSEAASYVVQPREHLGQRPQPFVTSAVRENKQYGCGPSNNLTFEANVRPAALRVELEPTGSVVVVPTRQWEDDASAESSAMFWLGRTMCRGPNLSLDALDQPMSVRLTAMYTDGSVDEGSWQRVDPPADGEPGRDEAAYVVERPARPSPLPDEPEQPGRTANQRPYYGWLWLLLSLPGLAALVAWRRRRTRA
jgi:hypothetical protein